MQTEKTERKNRNFRQMHAPSSCSQLVHCLPEKMSLDGNITERMKKIQYEISESSSFRKLEATNHLGLSSFLLGVRIRREFD